MAFDASLYMNRSFQSTDKGGTPMKKSFISLASLCLVLCMILTACAEIPTQDTTKTTTQQELTKEDISQNTNKTENAIGMMQIIHILSV